MIKTDAFRACRHRSILCIFRLLLRADRPVRALVVGRRPLLPFLALSACLSFLFSSSLTLVLLATQPEEKRTGGARPPSQPIGRVGGSANIARPFFCSLLSATSVCPRDSQSLCLYERILASLCISLMSSFFFLLFFRLRLSFFALALAPPLPFAAQLSDGASRMPDLAGTTQDRRWSASTTGKPQPKNGADRDASGRSRALTSEAKCEQAGYRIAKKGSHIRCAATTSTTYPCQIAMCRPPGHRSQHSSGQAIGMPCPGGRPRSRRGFSPSTRACCLALRMLASPCEE